MTIIPRTTDLVSLGMKRRPKQCPRWFVVALFVVGVDFLSGWLFPSGTTPFDDYKGIVTMNGVSNDVPWSAEKSLSRGSYTRSVPSAPVFDARSTSSDVHNQLCIMFVTPVSHCSVCDVDEAFSDVEAT